MLALRGEASSDARTGLIDPSRAQTSKRGIAPAHLRGGGFAYVHPDYTRRSGLTAVYGDALLATRTYGCPVARRDPRPYRDAMRQTEAALSRDQAQLRQAEANLARDTAQSKFTEADAARNQELSKLGVVARSQSDQIRANSNALLESMRADQAAIESATAAIESDRSAIDRAKLDLTYCEIRSPIAAPDAEPSRRISPCRTNRTVWRDEVILP